MTKSKHIPKRRFPGFEGEWEQKEFGKMCQRIQTGTTLLGCEQGKGIPLLKMGNIQRGYWDFTKLERLNQEIECENIIKYGDFLFNTRNTLELVGKGATWFIKEGLYGFNSNLARVTLDDVDTIFFNYLYNIPESIQQVKSRAVGTTSVAAIYPKDMSTIKFQLPTINEQKKLGNFFQTIDSLITLHQHKLDKLKSLKKAYLAELFPAEGERLPKRRFPGFEGEWEEKRIGEILETLPYKQFMKEPASSGDFEVIQQGHDPIIGFANGSPCNDFEDVVIFGDHTLSLYKPQKPFFVATDGVRILNGKNSMNGYYLYVLLERFKPKSEGYKRYFGILTDVEVSITNNIAEQEKIALLFQQIDKTITLQQEKLDKLKDLKKAYLNELFV